jgi:glutamate/tyrosine decarboxylase-like PLP-dependent enzyme
MATVIAVAAARQRAAARDGFDVREEGLHGHPPMVMYLSAEGHSCLRKAAELLGLGHRQVRVVPVDGEFHMDVDALRRLVAVDVRAGLRPFCVAANAGTVSTGAVDRLDEIADVAAENGMWFHIDGAYGALGVLADNAAATYAGMARADSLVLDPHKWLGVPVDCGCVLWRDPALTRATFSLVPAYLRDESGGALGWFSEYGPEQTRPFRSLRAWATMSNLGRDGIIRLVETTVQLARTLEAMINDAEDFELLAPVATSIVAFRFRPAGHEDRLDELNRRIPAAVQRRGRVFLTGTQLAGTEALRACLLNPMTTRDDLALLLNEIRAAATEAA